MEMVTRYAGEAHISAEDWAELNRGIVGAESYAFAEGRAFEAELISNNLLKIYDGCGVMQGREIRIPAGQSEEITIENGSQGEKRIDLVVERYTKNEDTKVESSETILIKGTPSETDPQVPACIEGDIRNGDTTADMPLYEVELDGINVVAVRPVFKILMDAAEMQEQIAAHEEEISELNGNLAEAILLKNYSLDNFTIPGDGYETAEVNAPIIPGYNRAMWWADCTNASSGGANMSMTNVYRISVTVGDDTVLVAVRNYGGSAAKVKVNLRMIYTRTFLN